MELYEEFVGRLRSQLEGVSCGHTSREPIHRGSSCILFHSLAILPPVLTEQQRAKMLKYKEDALKLTRQRKKTELNATMVHVQTLLESVQVRRAPTLEEFMESKTISFVTQSASCENASSKSSSQINGLVETRARLWDLLPPMCSTAKPVHDGKVDDFSIHTLASTASQPVEYSSEVDKQSRIKLTDLPHTPAVLDGVFSQTEDHKKVKSSLILELDVQDSAGSPETDGQKKDQLKTEFNLMGNLSESVSPPEFITQTFSLINVQKSAHSRPQLASGHNKFWSFPRPQLSSSPTRHIKGDSSTRKLLVNTALTPSGDSSSVGCSSMRGQNFPAKILEHSKQISKLEMSLSSLKSLISDLGAILVQDNKQTKEHDQEHKWPICASSTRLDLPDCLLNNTFRITPEGISNQPAEEDCCPSLNQSYDIEAPSNLWLQAKSDRGSVQMGEMVKEHVNNLGSRAKCRLLLNAANESIQTVCDSRVEGKPHSSTCKVWTTDPERHLKQGETEEEEQREQKLQLQRIALRYQHLCNLFFRDPVSGLRLRDVETSLLPGSPATPAIPLPSLSQTSGLARRWRPLLAAMCKGYLTRRLLRTERVSQLQRVAKDSQDFLLAFEPVRGVLVSKQDLVLLERVSLQLRSARYEIHDIFFSSTVQERMKMISGDRELARARELKRMKREEWRSQQIPEDTKSLERRRSWMVQKAEEIEKQWETKGRDGHIHHHHEHVCQKSIPALSTRV